MGLLLFIVALSLAVWGLEREPPYDVFRGYTHTFEAGAGGDGDGGAEHERLTRERRGARQEIACYGRLDEKGDKIGFIMGRWVKSCQNFVTKSPQQGENGPV